MKNKLPKIVKILKINKSLFDLRIDLKEKAIEEAKIKNIMVLNGKNESKEKYFS